MESDSGLDGLGPKTGGAEESENESESDGLDGHGGPKAKTGVARAPQSLVLSR
jgi:hypothetical protein